MRYHDGTKWTDRVADSGKQSADACSAESSPSVVVADDGDVLWSAARKTMTPAAPGGRVATARYRLTKSHLIFEAGLMSTTEERVPLWALGEIDVEQSMTQKARNVGAISIRLLQRHHTGRDTVKLEGVSDPKRVRDLIERHAQEARAERLRARSRSSVQHLSGGPSAPAPWPPATGSISDADTFTMLRELHRRGVITADELAGFVQRADANSS